ncbi:MAG TPA: SURF1 family protein [Marmoricola sp.]|nr:SURF1 family protein [Marmoricola sp.]
MRFLLSRRWVLFALVVAFLAWLAVQLGQWQFHRLEERREHNQVVSTNRHADPVPIDEVMSPDRAPAPDDEWQRVRVTGTWDEGGTIVLKYQTRDSGPGVDVVTPLVTEDGTAVLVDRGWLKVDNTRDERPDLPAAGDGEVTVTGWVRRDATGGATEVSDLAARAISSRAAAEVLPYPLYRGFLDLDEQTPSPETELEPVELPDDTSEGPHFFYGLQWWFFGALAIFGFGYLAWDEYRGRQGTPGLRGRSRRPATAGADSSERPEHAAVHGQHRPADEG